jgi:hypothetical protein
MMLTQEKRGERTIERRNGRGNSNKIRQLLNVINSI